MPLPMLVVPTFILTELAVRHFVRQRYGIGPPTVIDLLSGELSGHDMITEELMREALERSLMNGGPGVRPCSQATIDALPAPAEEEEADGEAPEVKSCAVCLDNLDNQDA